MGLTTNPRKSAGIAAGEVRLDPIDSQARRTLASNTAARIAEPEQVFADPEIDGDIIASSTDPRANLLEQAIHDFDVARYLLGEEIFSIYAVGGCLIDPAISSAGDIDTAMITLKSRSGRLVQMNNCRRAAFGYDQRLEAVCSKEVLSVGNSLQNTLTIADSAGFHTAPPENYFIERFAQAYRLEMDAFIALLRDGAAPLAGIRDGLEAQRLAEAAQVSLQSGQPVELGPDWVPG